MSDLRLLPPALALWLAMVMLVIAGSTTWLICAVIALLASVALWLFKPAGRGIIAVTWAITLAGCGHLFSGIQTNQDFLDHYSKQSTMIVGELTSAVSMNTAGGYFRMQPESLDVEIACFFKTDGTFSVPLKELAEPALVPGATIKVNAQARPTVGYPAVVLQVSNIELLGAPVGIPAFANKVQASFRALSQQQLQGPAQGLLPAMVLGDTSLQTGQEKQWYIDTGLAHLSAVSGGNLTIIIAMVVVLATFMGCSPRMQACLALVAIGAFICVVGTEPSVWRAGMMGVVNLVALLGYRRTQCFHVLCLGIIVLLLWQPYLACSFGFALSVAATGGIVMGYPALYKALALRWMPDILARGLAIAIAADLATLPIIAAMAGKIPLLGIVANVLAAPMVGVITIGGIIAVLCLPLPGVSAAILWALQAPAWWIGFVAAKVAHHPYATFNTGTTALGIAWIVVITCWLLWLWVYWGKYALSAFCAFLVLGALLPLGRPRESQWVNIDSFAHIEVASTAEIPAQLPAGVVVKVLETGKPHKRPVAHPAGNIIWYPNRDGLVQVDSTGRQRAPQGKFGLP